MRREAPCMHHLLQENFYLRQRIQELERENQYIRLMLSAKTLLIENVHFNLDNISIENLSGSLQIGIAHHAQEASPVCLPRLKEPPSFRI